MQILQSISGMHCPHERPSRWEKCLFLTLWFVQEVFQKKGFAYNDSNRSFRWVNPNKIRAFHNRLETPL